MGFFILMWVIVDFRWCLPTLRCCLNARVVMQKRAEHENSGDGVIVVVNMALPKWRKIVFRC